MWHPDRARQAPVVRPGRSPLPAKQDPLVNLATWKSLIKANPDGLAYLGEPQRGAGSALASPVCYLGEIERE